MDPNGTFNCTAATPCGSASGTGDLFWWNPPLNGGLGDWALSQGGVSFAITFAAGQGGKNGTAKFGIIINHVVASPPEPSSLPNSKPSQLKGGTINAN